jgi:nicotinate-nucleotide adenylyltransferase
VRLGIFGGSFDPPHVGHLLAATDAFEQLSLDRLVFIPAATQPLKVGRVVAGAEHRLAMVRLLLGDDSRFEVSTVELERDGLSFTVDTLEHFARAYPGAELVLLAGADVLETFHQWRNTERVMELARLAVLERRGEQTALPKKMKAGSVQRLQTRRIDVSSTEIRERVRRGQQIRGFVTEGVAAHIERSGLYR